MGMVHGIASMFLVLLAATAGADERPNILWIIGEDLGPELGCYGTAESRTPNLDGLAARGLRYTRAFTVAPVCSTSRSAFMTGMYQTTIGAHHHRSHRDDGYTLPDGVRLLPHWLQDAGYYTANLKHLTDAPKSWFRGTGKDDWNFKVERKPWDSNRWSDLEDHQPFYAQVSFSETHRGGAWDTSHEHIETPADPAEVVIPSYYPDHPLVREDWAQYLNTVMALDKKVGFVLRRLQEDGLAENTVVFFLGDHGRAMVRGKQWPYDSGLHVPFLVSWPAGLPAPEGYAAGEVRDELVCSLDFTATTLAFAGVTRPPAMQGRVILGADREAPREMVFGGRDRGDETVDRIRTVRDARFRYLRNYYPDRPFLQLNRYKEFQYPVIHLMRFLHERGELTEAQAALLAPTRPAEELYDLVADPYETHNLVSSPEHQEVLVRLRAALDQWIEESDDQGRHPESPEIHAMWEARMKKNYDAKIEKRVQALRQEFEELHGPADGSERDS